jgi:hypothetical protein
MSVLTLGAIVGGRRTISDTDPVHHSGCRSPERSG